MNELEDNSAGLTEEAMLANKLARAMLVEDIDEAFREIGRFMDKYRYQVSSSVCDEYRLADRIQSDS